MLAVTHLFATVCMLPTCSFDYELIGFICSQQTPFGTDRSIALPAFLPRGFEGQYSELPTGPVADLCTLKGTYPVKTSLSQISSCNAHLQSVWSPG